ncbi:hypothetical protein [Actinoplanes sp. NPDC049681]|uniref:hypothetical protein n=1 Tax=Actinoplanes sp. NPDC049681 TaxID=3363905 RepID=UPI0037A6944A
MIGSRTPPRGRAARIAVAAVLGVALLLASVGPETLVSEITGSKYLGWFVSGILPCLFGTWIAPKVSYRRRDALILLTMGPSAMPSGPLLLKIIWRTAYLPHRDWPLRADEVAAGRSTSHVPPPVVEPEPATVAVTVSSPSLPPWARDVTAG